MLLMPSAAEGKNIIKMTDPAFDRMILKVFPQTRRLTRQDRKNPSAPSSDVLWWNENAFLQEKNI